ncbi:MAG: membrane protein [Ginsengibacter sp.]
MKAIHTNTTTLSAGQMLNKVPQITLFFWIIKILCTTVGETCADWLNENLKLGLTGTSVVMGILLIIALIVQFRVNRYIPSIYWLTVVLISVVGTLITDNLTDNLGVSLQTTTIVFATALSITFIIWYMSEKTLSIHKVNTTKREAFYWLAILFTFALGTAAGDLLAESLKLGYLLSLGIFAAVIALDFLAYKIFRINAVLAFWIAYILTRPLGASIGDYMSQDQKNGGLGLGPVVTSVIFLVAILATVIYLSKTKKDVIKD